MLTHKQFDLLVHLTEQDGPQSQRALSRDLHMSVGTVNKLSRELGELGYIENGSITAAGREALEPYRVKRAVFMAAGFGSRMVPITLNTPKPLVRVKGVRIIDTLLDALLAAGIEEIYIVRGYLKEQFDQLLYKYPMIRFIDNPMYNEANAIVSVMLADEKVRNAYILEADLYLSNPKLITPYQYRSNYLGIYMDRTDDDCLFVENGIIKGGAVGGVNCYQTVGISYWTDEDGKRLARQIKEVVASPGGKELFFGAVPIRIHKEDYEVGVRECYIEDVVEIDSYRELVAIDPSYAV